MSTDADPLIDLRRELHAHPEPSGKESGTARRILRFLEGCRPDEILTDLGGHGILATWDSGRDGPSLLLRSELDALPIQEQGRRPHRSTRDGVAHLCGHDGHSAILCGVARALGKQPPGKGLVRLLFQPAEETGQGAAAVLEDPRFLARLPDRLFALHNLPGFPLHQVILRAGPFSAAVRSMVIDLKGQSVHAAEPEKGINPAMAFSLMLQEAAKASRPLGKGESFRLVTPVFAELGTPGYGSAAGEASLHFTLRAWTDQALRALEAELEDLARNLARESSLECRITYLEPFPSTVNAPDAVEAVEQAARAAGLPVTFASLPFRWGEDFGHFSAIRPVCLIGLGAGEDGPPLHHPDYDFPDALLSTGIKLFHYLIRQCLDA